MRAYHRGGSSQQQTKIISAEKVAILISKFFNVLLCELLGEEGAGDGGGLCLRICPHFVVYSET